MHCEDSIPLHRCPIKQAPMKLANDITKSSNKNWDLDKISTGCDVPGLDAIHIPAPITSIDAKSMNNFKNPITVLLNLYTLITCKVALL